MGLILDRAGRWLGNYLARPSHVHRASAGTSAEALRECLQPADVLLVEGDSRVSTAIKYLTQSTWSHAALHVGDALASHRGRGQHVFVEADIVEGVRSVGLSAFVGLHTRICRPVGLSDADRDKVIDFAIRRIGHQYDLRNVVDLARYLLPEPPVPVRFRRRMLALGSGDPTRAICSTLIAQAFQSVRYPILPEVSHGPSRDRDCPGCIEARHHIRHHSLFAPRDFDVSPYFEIIKPTLARGFDYSAMVWDDDDAGPEA